MNNKHNKKRKKKLKQKKITIKHHKKKRNLNNLNNNMKLSNKIKLLPKNIKKISQQNKFTAGKKQIMIPYKNL